MEEIADKTDKRRVFGFGFFDTPQIREQRGFGGGERVAENLHSLSRV